ncbi:MAG: hypothetical protein HY231_23995 [Acidobacteria bacterium]|nr:hypothetical protein [Acidobacteriota bacterium]
MLFMHSWQKVLQGKQTLTTRPVRGCYVTNRTYAIRKERCGKPIGRIRITEIFTKRSAGRISDEDILQEGFKSKKSFEDAYAARFGRDAVYQPVWCFRFELVESYLSEKEIAGEPVGIRTAIINSYHLGKNVLKDSVLEILQHSFLSLAYGAAFGMRRKNCMPIKDMNALLEKWKSVIVGLATAHDKDEEDAFEAQVNDLLTPLLTARTKEVREFFDLLMAALKEDQSVPYFVWRSLEFYGSAFKLLPDEGIIRLKKQLATEIAEIVEQDVLPDFKDAMIKALMWRDGDRLEAIKTAALEAKAKGGKIELKGRESCLFLEVSRGRGKKKEVVQV